MFGVEDKAVFEEADQMLVYYRSSCHSTQITPQRSSRCHRTRVGTHTHTHTHTYTRARTRTDIDDKCSHKAFALQPSGPADALLPLSGRVSALAPFLLLGGAGCIHIRRQNAHIKVSGARHRRRRLRHRHDPLGGAVNKK